MGSSRRYKRLTWRSQGQLQIRLRFCSKLQIKRIHNKHTHTLICGVFCYIYQSLIKSVWNYTKRHPRSFVLILWTSFTPQVMKMLILLASSHCPFIKVKRFLACQTKTLNGRFPILTTLPSSKLMDCYSNDPIVHGAKS